MAPDGAVLPCGGSCCSISGLTGKCIFSWNAGKNVNDSVWTVVQYYEHPVWGPLGGCGWGATVQDAVHMQHYTDTNCLNLDYERDVDIILTAYPMSRSGPPPYIAVGGLIQIWDFVNGWLMDTIWGQVNEGVERDSECLNAQDVVGEASFGPGTVTFADV